MDFESIIATDSRKDCIALCAVAEKSSRCADMLTLMRHVVSAFDEELSLEERNYFSTAWKEAVGGHRETLAVLQAAEDTDARAEAIGITRMTTRQCELLDKRRADVRAKCATLCEEVIDLLRTRLLPFCTMEESGVVYLKMTADYNRYLAELSTGAAREEYAARAGDAYTDALKAAWEKLAPTNPVTLGIALNFSVFHNEIGRNREKATAVAQLALSDFEDGCDTMQPKHEQDSGVIVQLIRQNLSVWAMDTPSQVEINQGPPFEGDSEVGSTVHSHEEHGEKEKLVVYVDEQPVDTKQIVA